MSLVEAAQRLIIQGKGLITGQPVTVTVEPGLANQGVVFYRDTVSPETAIPAALNSVVNTDRGVTLANAQGQTLSIVEHFLCAVSLSGYRDLTVVVSGAPELPILDGSARPWLEAFQAAIWPEPPGIEPLSLSGAVVYRHREDICLYALPAPHFQITYAVDFQHADLRTRWARWDSRVDDPLLLAGAGTYGYLNELPALQARGLALGVDADNTLGLLEDGGYTRPLRMPDEPIWHKMVDLIGDLTLAGLNPMALQAHLVAIHAGHDSHLAFARRLLKALR